MRVAFRVDASIEMGTGHVIRCLTLADELKRRDIETRFIMREHDGHLARLVRGRGHHTVLLPRLSADFVPDQEAVPHAHWLGVSWEQDAEDTLVAITDSRPDWLVVDHYGIDIRWHDVVRKMVGRVMVIDDLADRQLGCALLLDQTFGREPGDYAQCVPEACHQLLGSEYALLRPEFTKLRSAAIEKRKQFHGVRRILVSMGGIDAGNFSHVVLEGLEKVQWKAVLIIDVVMGGNAPHLHAVRQWERRSGIQVTVSTDVDDMANRMLEADLAIGAGGTTSWERCCLGLPTLMILTADNQIEVGRLLDKAGAVRLLGSQDRIDATCIHSAVEAMLDNERLWKFMAEACAGITRGLGVRRVMAEMNPPLSKDKRLATLRPVVMADVDLLYAWQIDEGTRRYAHDTAVPAYDDHVGWLRGRLGQSHSLTEMILHGDDPAGVIRIDPLDGLSQPTYIISIYVASDKYRLGLGKCALQIMRGLVPEAELRAEVNMGNVASHALFSSAGYREKAGIGYVSEPIENDGCWK